MSACVLMWRPMLTQNCMYHPLSCDYDLMVHFFCTQSLKYMIFLTITEKNLSEFYGNINYELHIMLGRALKEALKESEKEYFLCTKQMRGSHQ